MRLAASIAAVPTAVMLLSGCGVIEPDRWGRARSELEDHRALWESAGSDHYQYRLTRICECLPEMSGNLLVTVQDGVVVAAESEDLDERVPDQYLDGLETVEVLFDRISAAIDDRVFRLQAEYDPVLGYPRFVNVLYEPRVVDNIVVSTRDLVVLD